MPPEAAGHRVRQQLPSQVALDVGHSEPDRRHPHVVDHDEPVRPHNPIGEEEVEEHALEAMVTVDHREIERPPCCGEPRQGELRLLRELLHKILDSRLANRARSGPAEVVRERLDHNVVGAGAVDREQRLAERERPEPQPQPDLERGADLFRDRKVANLARVDLGEAVRVEGHGAPVIALCLPLLVQPVEIPTDIGRVHVGSISPMAVDVRTQVDIDRPRNEVAAFAADPDNATSWYANIKQVTWKTPRPLAVGSRFEFVAEFLGRRLQYTYEVAEHLPGERFVMQTSERPFPMRTTYTWRDAPGDGTAMELQNDGEPSGFKAIAAPLMAAAMKRENRKDLRRLKALLESD